MMISHIFWRRYVRPASTACDRPNEQLRMDGLVTHRVHSFSKFSINLICLENCTLAQLTTYTSSSFAIQYRGGREAKIISRSECKL